MLPFLASLLLLLVVRILPLPYILTRTMKTPLPLLSHDDDLRPIWIDSDMEEEGKQWRRPAMGSTTT